MMRFIAKTMVFTSVLILLSYYGSFFILPSVTVINNSGGDIEHIEIALPDSNLNFGPLANGENNTVHYSLKQDSGTYHYEFSAKNAFVINGSCGYVNHYEFNKRVVITLYKDGHVECDLAD